MMSTKKLAMAALMALGLLALFAGPASAMKYSLNIAHPEGGSTGALNAGGMATDSAGNLYVAEPGKIEKFDSSGKYLTRFFTSWTGSALDVDVDSTGNVWVAAGSELFKFNASGTLLKKVFAAETPKALATDPSANVYSLGAYNAFRYDTNGSLVGTWLGTAGFSGKATDVDVDSAGTIWSATAASNVIRSHQASGKVLTEWTLPTIPAGLAGDNSGNVWAAEPGFCRVKKYSSAGKALESFGECGTGVGKLQYEKMPHERPGIASGPGGVVWVSNGTEVQKWIP